MTAPRPTLAIIPTTLSTPAQLELAVGSLVSLWTTADDVEVLVIDDASPATGLVDQLEAATCELGFALHRKATHDGIAATVNLGLRHALAHDRDALVLSPEFSFPEAGWLERLHARTDTLGRPAAVVGGLLLFPNGLIAHAGMFFSLLSREFRYRHRMGPADLPEALTPCRCPVSGALALIRHETIDAIGVYDEDFPLGWEDVDYCLRAFDAGLECIYEPSVVAEYEPTEDQKPDQATIEARKRSAKHMLRKYRTADLSAYVPDLKG